jgi:branched-chain amino acid transport system ATP-binding protein
VSAPANGLLLDVRGLSKAFGGVRAVDNVDLALRPGEIRCIIGPNGAGKSTFFKLLLGSIRPDRGVIRFSGRDITRLQLHQRTHLGMGIKFQNLGVYQAFTVHHNLQLPLQHRLSGEAMEREIARLLESLHLRGTEDQLVGSLSHGQKQWLAIGMALAMKPSLLLLDEPTAGMGPEETRATGKLVETVHGQGVTVLVVEHDMAFVRQLGAPVTVLHHGRVLAEGSLADIEHNDEVRRIYLGTTGRPRARRRR